MGGEHHAGLSLEFEFDDSLPFPSGESRRVDVAEGATSSLSIYTSVTPCDARLDSVPWQRHGPTVGKEPSGRAAEWALTFCDEGLNSAGAPTKLFSQSLDQEVAAEPRVLPVAPFDERLKAGLADCLALLAAGAIFVLIFLKAGGSFERQTLDLVVLLFISSFLVFVYFALFSIFTFQTPGEAWRGLAIRNLGGELPTVSESLWRATGYVVSAGALMLGFVWALMDSDGFGWHDRMSGTYLISVRER
jgi:uncharacterized RDD family membrane protein YckC